MSEKSNAVDVVVVGGGMAGATLCCALAQTSLKVILIESGHMPKWNVDQYDLRISAINLASENIFRSLNIWTNIRERRISEFHDIETWDENSNSRIVFRAAEAGLRHLGHIIENNSITQALHKKLAQQKVQLHYGVSIDGFHYENGNIIISADDGHKFQARLLVGADGALSRVRELAGIDVDQHSYHQRSIVAHVTTESSNRQTAYQRFLSTGPLAFLPLSEKRSSIVWSTDEQLAENLVQLSSHEFQKQLETAFQNRLGNITSSSHRACFSISHRHAKTYVNHRLALIGDAAHTAHPLAGLGANQGLADAATLAEIIISSIKQERDFGKQGALRRYERWRRGENQLILNVLDGLHYVFQNSHPTIARLRYLGLNLTNRITPLKTFLIERAVGLKGDLPKMAKSSFPS